MFKVEILFWKKKKQTFTLNTLSALGKKAKSLLTSVAG